jgi:hypothetical protein
MHIGFWWKSRKEGDQSEDLDICGRMILKWILAIKCGGMYWIDLARDRDQWRALVNTVMNLRVL